MTTALPARLRNRTGPQPGPRPAPQPGPRATIRSGAPALGRVAAVLALGSAALHVVLAVSGELSALAMAAMALVCLPCAVHLWRRPSASVWGLTALVDLGMLALHAPMLAAPGMHHDMGAGPGSVGVVALALVVGQLALAAVVGLTALLRR